VLKKLFASASWRIQKAHAFNPRYELFEHRNPFFDHLGLDGDNACDVVVMTFQARACHIRKNNRNCSCCSRRECQGWLVADQDRVRIQIHDVGGMGAQAIRRVARPTIFDPQIDAPFPTQLC
jgi:hypothetical protein